MTNNIVEIYQQGFLFSGDLKGEGPKKGIINDKMVYQKMNELFRKVGAQRTETKSKVTVCYKGLKMSGDFKHQGVQDNEQSLKHHFALAELEKAVAKHKRVERVIEIMGWRNITKAHLEIELQEHMELLRSILLMVDGNKKKKELQND